MTLCILDLGQTGEQEIAIALNAFESASQT